MNRGFSLSLDLVRFCAAMTVFLYHFGYERISGNLLWRMAGPYGHDAVVVFFVLSGLVMAYVTGERENTPYKYFRARFARLYSVVIPMLLLVPVADAIGRHFNASLYDGWWFQSDHPALRFALSLGFLHEIWWTSTRYFSDGPYWSIAYEFWYYVAFGALCFLRGPTRWIACAAVMLVAGPKILLLFPVWLLGVVTWRLARGRKLPTTASISILAACAMIYAVWIHLGIYKLGENFGASILGAIHISRDQIGWSALWLDDYVLGILVAVAFVSLASLSDIAAKVLTPVQRPVRWLAGATFTVYLMHYPLMQLLAALVPGSPRDPIRAAEMFLAMMALMLLLAEFTEKRKSIWARAIDRLTDPFRQRPAAQIAEP